MHLVIVTGLELVVSLVIGFVVLGRCGEFRVVIGNLPLDVGQPGFDGLDRLAELAHQLLLLLFLLVPPVCRKENSDCIYDS